MPCSMGYDYAYVCIFTMSTLSICGVYESMTVFVVSRTARLLFMPLPWAEILKLFCSCWGPTQTPPWWTRSDTSSNVTGKETYISHRNVFSPVCRVMNFRQISQKAIASSRFYVQSSWTWRADASPQDQRDNKDIIQYRICSDVLYKLLFNYTVIWEYEHPE